jgi:hypothetical protein
MLRNYDDKHKEQQPDKMERMESRATKQASAMLSINNMNYDAPVSSSCILDRVQTNFPFSPNAFNNVNSSTLANVIFNTGASVVNSATSSIIFSVHFENAPANLCWGWGDNITAGTANTLKSGGCATNLFSQIDLKARGGEFPVRIIDSNILSSALQPFQKNMSSDLLYQECGGASYTVKPSAVASYANANYNFPIWYANDTITFEIPLGKLLGGTFFSESSPLPPSLASGMTLSLRFENFLRAMVFYTSSVDWTLNNNGAPPAGTIALVVQSPVITTPTLSLNVNNMQLMLDLMTPFDSVQNALASKASSLASSGLQYDYLGVYQAKTTVFSSSANIDVLISAAQLYSIIISFVKPAGQANGRYDAMARLPIVSYNRDQSGNDVVGNSVWKSTSGSVGQLGSSGSIRVRIGSQYLTLSPVQSAGQLYRYAYQSLCAIKGGLITDVDPLHTINKPIDHNISFNDWYTGSGGSTISFDCTKTPLLANSGAQTNNSRSVIIELQGMNFDASHPAEVIVHCLYQNVVNSSTENNVVDR